MVFCICCNGGIVTVVSVTASMRVVVDIITYLFSCMFCGGICGFCNGSGGSDVSWVVIVLMVTVRYWWSSDGGCDDDRCCKANGGSCD